MYEDVFQTGSPFNNSDFFIATNSVLRCCSRAETKTETSRNKIRPRKPNAGSKTVHNDVSKANTERYLAYRTHSRLLKDASSSTFNIDLDPPIEYVCRNTHNMVMMCYFWFVASKPSTALREENANPERYDVLKKKYLPFLQMVYTAPGRSFPWPALNMTHPTTAAYFEMWDTFQAFQDDLAAWRFQFPDYARALAHMYLTIVASDTLSRVSGLSGPTLAVLHGLITRCLADSQNLVDPRKIRALRIESIRDWYTDWSRTYREAHILEAVNQFSQGLEGGAGAGEYDYDGRGEGGAGEGASESKSESKSESESDMDDED
jgi:hypothetical protein